MKETVICRLCLEPVQNFICIDCFLEAIHLWLLSKNAEVLAPLVQQKHNELKIMLSSDTNTGICIRCRQEVSEWACPCCYLYEMYNVIKLNKPELSKEFEEKFNLDFNYHHGFSQLTFWDSLHQETINSKNFKPVIIVSKRNNSDLNICENCGQISDNLIDDEGWLCESCIDNK